MEQEPSFRSGMFVLLAVLGVFAALLFVAVRRGLQGRNSSRPRPRPLWARVVCGVLAAGVVSTIIIETVNGTSGDYIAVGDTIPQAVPLSAIPVQAPSLPPPPIETFGRENEDRCLLYVYDYEETTRSLRHSFLRMIDKVYVNPSWIYCREIFLGKEFMWEISDGQFQRKINGTINFDTTTATWGVKNLNQEYKNPTGYGSKTAESMRWKSDPWGAISPESDFGILPVRRDDPLTTISFRGWQQQYVYRGDRPSTISQFFKVYSKHALVLLFLAAILASQCFTRRAMGLVVSCLCAMLLVVALDRIVLEIHASHLAPDQPAATRAYARSQLDATFFFQKTAERLARQ